MPDTPATATEHPAAPPGADAALAIDERARKAALLTVFLVVFIDLLGFGIVLPLLPLYAKDLLLPIMPAEDQRQLRGLVLGLLMSSFSAMQFLFAPIWGRISDRVGRRPILLLGLGGSVIFYALFGVASDIGASGSAALGLTLIFIARIGAGMAGATISTAQAVIADSTTPEKRSHGMALIGAAFGIGFTFGPLLAAASFVVPVHGAPGYAAAIFSAVALIIGWLRMPETLRTGAIGKKRHWLDWHGVQTTLRNPAVGILIVTFFLATLAFGGLESTLAFVNQVLLHPETELTRETATDVILSVAMLRQNSFVFAYVGLVLMLTQAFFYRRFVHRVGEVRFMRMGILLMGLGLVDAVVILLTRDPVATQAWELALAVISVTVAVMGFALLTPSLQALISRRSDAAIQGEVLGVNQSASAMARILGPMVGVPLFFATTSHFLPYAVGAAMLILVLGLTFRIHQD
jgi:MFS transporter, DHA1 family, tetracycline resistance protein